MPTSPSVRRRFGSFAVALALLALQLTPVVAAEITTDLWVYQTGDTVTLTGVDYAPDETVEIVTTDPYAVEVDRGTAQTDLYGGFTYAFVLTSDVAGIFDVVATGLSSGLSAATQFDPAPTVPANLRYLDARDGAGAGTVTLTWDTSTGGPDCYRVYRSTGSMGAPAGTNVCTGAQPANGIAHVTSGTSYTDGPGAGDFYYYVVSIKTGGGGGQSLASNQVTTKDTNGSLPSGAFGSVNIGSSSAGTLYTVTNNSGATIKFQSVTKTGSNPGDFGVIGAPVAGTSVLTGTSFTFTVTFSPTGVGARSATLNINVSDGALLVSNTRTSPVTGTGVDGTAPAGASVNIDNGAVSATSTTVNLRLIATDTIGVTTYRVANGPTCATSILGASFVAPFAATPSLDLNPGPAFTLTTGGGTKTVCAQFKDGAGNESAVVSDTITFQAATGITETLTPSTITYGETTHSSGVLTDGSNAAALVGFTVNDNLSNNPCNSTGTFIGTDTTDLSGVYDISYRPVDTGNGSEQVKASYAGDLSHGAASVCALLTINRAPTSTSMSLLSSSINTAGLTTASAAVLSHYGIAGNLAEGTLSFEVFDADNCSGTALSTSGTNETVSVSQGDADNLPTSEIGFQFNSAGTHTLSGLAAGSYGIRALYTVKGSDKNYLDSSDCKILTVTSADSIKPVITATALKADLSAYVANTWTNQSVTVTFSCADEPGGSGLATNTVGGGGTVSADTAVGSFTNTGTCVDNAGNVADPVTFSPIKVDKTRPVISAMALKADLSAYVAGTWTNQSVTVTFTCDDTGSGIDTDSTALDGGTESGDTATGSFTSLGSHCVDLVGNGATTVTFSPIKIDKTAPVISSSATANALPYVAGTWTKYDVSVSFSCADQGSVQSGIVTDTVAGDNATVSTEGAAQSVSSDGDCIDAAGNSDSSETFSPIKIDKTAPVISSSATANALPYVAGTWTKYDVSVSFSCADQGSVQSGIVTDTVAGDNATVSTEGAAQSVSSDGDCIDAAGNSDSSETFSPIKIDKTAPVISSSATANALPYVAGTWTKYDVSVSFSCADQGSVQSGIVTDTVAGDNATVSTEGAAQSVSSDGDCIDAAGNSDSSETFSPIKIDKTAPVISSSATANALPYVAGTWTKYDVSVSFSCADQGSVQSGIVTDTVAGDNATVSTEGAAQSVSSDGDCIDAAGNSDSSETFSPIKIDKTNPVVSITFPTNTWYFQATWEAGCSTAGFGDFCGTASDALSGLSGNTEASIYRVSTNRWWDWGAMSFTSSTESFTAVGGAAWNKAFSYANFPLSGDYTVHAVATDMAGNSGGASTTFTLNRYTIDFQQPLDDTIGSAIVKNTGKYGRVIPVKVVILKDGVAQTSANFSGSDVFTIGVNHMTSCSVGATDGIETYADAGASNGNTNQFRWADGQLIYNLDTGRPPAGVSMVINNCYRIDVYLNTGKLSLDRYAVFQPTK